jgi:hypothetical protein
MAFLDLLSAVAHVVGGTQPAQNQTTVSATQLPYWYSGHDTGDSSGVAGLAGCWSVPTEVIGATPVGMVLPGPWRPDSSMPAFPMQGHKFTEDEVHVRIMVGHDAEQALMARLVNFRDTVPPVFDAHMQLLNTTGVSSAWCNEGDFLEVQWGGNVYFALAFIVRVQRGTNVTYSA